MKSYIISFKFWMHGLLCFTEIQSVNTFLFGVDSDFIQSSFVVYYLVLSDTEGFEIIYLWGIVSCSTFDYSRQFAAERWCQSLCRPLDLFVLHGLRRLIGSETHLCDFNRSRWTLIDILIKLVSELPNINLERFPILVKTISEVLKTRSNDVFAHWKQSVLNRGVINWMERNRASVGAFSGEGVHGCFIIENEEIL